MLPSGLVEVTAPLPMDPAGSVFEQQQAANGISEVWIPPVTISVGARAGEVNQNRKPGVSSGIP